MRRRRCLSIILAITLTACVQPATSDGVASTSTPTPTPSAAATPAATTPAPSPTETPTPTVEATAIPTSAPVSTPAPTAQPTAPPPATIRPTLPPTAPPPPQQTIAPTAPPPTPSPTPVRTIAPRPVVVGVHSATDVDGSVCRGCTYIHVTFSAPMLIIGEGSGVTMVGNYQLDARPLAQSTPIACGSPSCDLIRIDITPALPLDSQHVLRIANVVDRNGMGINPDPTLVTFRVERS